MTVEECRMAKSTKEIFIRRGCGLDHGDSAFTITGSGMSPVYNNGDTVMVQYSDTLEPGAIGIFLVDGKQPAIRQYYPDGLRSFRPDLETMHLNAPVSEYPIIGKVVGVITGAMRPSPAEEAMLQKLQNDDQIHLSASSQNRSIK